MPSLHFLHWDFQEKEDEYKALLTRLEDTLQEKNAELEALRSDIETERQEMEEKVRSEMSRHFQSEVKHHQEEVTGLSREWEIERKVWVVL